MTRFLDEDMNLLSDEEVCSLMADGKKWREKSKDKTIKHLYDKDLNNLLKYRDIVIYLKKRIKELDELAEEQHQHQEYNSKSYTEETLEELQSILKSGGEIKENYLGGKNE